MNEYVGTVSGFGFSVGGLEVEKVLHFAINHRSSLVGFDEYLDKMFDFYEIYQDSLKNMNDVDFLREFAKEFPNYPAWLEEIEDRVSGTPGWSSIVSTTIYNEQGITVGFEINEEDDVIMFYSTMPWNFNDKEKTLTEDSLKKLFLPYMAELDIPEEEYGFYHMAFL